jgi:signal transduction histidine kinase
MMRNHDLEVAEGIRRPFYDDRPEFLLDSELRYQYLEDLNIARHFLLRNILLIDVFVLLISSFLSYLLAGETLKPIEKMIKIQSSFISDASHELRTPITAIQSSLEVALRDKKMKKEEAIRVLEENLEDIEGLKILSEQLLNLASYQENIESLNKVKVDLQLLADSVFTELDKIAKKKKIKLSKEVEDLELDLDRDKVKQLLTILLDNAIKYSKAKSEVKLKMSLEKDRLLIEVSDQGMGISDDDLEHIFDRFYKSNQARTKDQSGSFGLGLAIAKKIADLYKTEIKVESELSKGSTFSVKIPV